MTGLEYILNKKNLKGIDVAKQLKISKQRLNNWVKGKASISEEYMKGLEKITFMPKYLIEKKDLTLLEEIAIDQELISKEKNEINNKINKLNNIR